MHAEMVLLDDRRQYLSDSRREPYRWICSVEVVFPEPLRYALAPLESNVSSWAKVKPTRLGCGTGLLISPRHVLTSAHVVSGLKLVHHPKRPRQFRVVAAQQIQVIPGRHEQQEDHRPFGQWQGSSLSINPAYRKLLERAPAKLGRKAIRKVLAEDYALVTLPAGAKKNIHPGWWGQKPDYDLCALSLKDRKRLLGRTVTLTGYPGDKAAYPCGIPYRSSDLLVETMYQEDRQLRDLLLYQADTSIGMSGSPVWVKTRSGTSRLLGVHSSFFSYRDRRNGQWTQSNVAAMLSPQMLRWLEGEGVFD